MNNKLARYIISYSFLIAIILTVSTFILFQVVQHTNVLIIVQTVELVLLISIIVYFFRKYVKPIEKASKTMDKLLKGNYHARIHHQMNGSIGELSTKINSLARNLSELTIQEQIQAEQLSTVIENSESGLVLIDEKGYIHVVNRKFTNMFGKDTQNYIGHIYYDVIENEQIHHAVQQTFLYEKRVKHLFSLEKDGEITYLEVVGAPIFNEHNLIKGVVLVIYDITEFKNIEQIRKDFVANVSHELKTPITSIKGFTETLLDGADEDEATRKQFLEIIYKESNRIQHLIDDLLILSRLEKEDMTLQIADIDTTDLIDNIAPALQQQAEQRNISLHINVPQQFSFRADEEKMQQLLINLLLNAIIYTPQGGEVSLEIKRKTSEVIFTVSDTGIGIQKEDLPRIFERFYRVDKDRSRHTGGTGLGLAIVKHIVEVHNGEIDVESEVGKGTTFTVSIPKQGEKEE